MGEEKSRPSSVWPTIKPFVNGGASGMLATCVIQPIDMIKVSGHPPQTSRFFVSGSSQSKNPIFWRICAVWSDGYPLVCFILKFHAFPFLGHLKIVHLRLKIRSFGGFCCFRWVSSSLHPPQISFISVSGSSQNRSFLG